jgi:hypothetical protein
MQNDFYIQSLFYDTLTNGFRDDINKNTEILGFILGAIETGFSVNKTGAIRAKKSKVEIYLRNKRDTNELYVVIFKGKEKQLEIPYDTESFLWDKVTIRKGRLTIEKHGFICSLT